MPQDTLILVKKSKIKISVDESQEYSLYCIQNTREKHKILGETMRLRALAKINLGLDVVRKRRMDIMKCG